MDGYRRPGEFNSEFLWNNDVAESYSVLRECKIERDFYCSDKKYFLIIKEFRAAEFGEELTYYPFEEYDEKEICAKILEITIEEFIEKMSDFQGQSENERICFKTQSCGKNAQNWVEDRLEKINKDEETKIKKGDDY